MKIFNLFSLFLIALFFIQCKKDSASPEVITAPIPVPTSVIMDTIYPSNYFPAYPKSYWRYLDTNGDTSAVYTSNTYIKDRYLKDIANNIWDSAYVPKCNGIPIYGYTEHRSDLQYLISGFFPKFMSELDGIGTSWNYVRYGAYYIYNRKVIVKDTTINIGGVNYYPTIVIEDLTGTIPVPTYRRYYTKDVGLIRLEYLVLGSGSSFVPSKTVNLQSYFINH
jgi:hypothetical protein